MRNHLEAIACQLIQIGDHLDNTRYSMETLKALQGEALILHDRIAGAIGRRLAFKGPYRGLLDKIGKPDGDAA